MRLLSTFALCFFFACCSCWGQGKQAAKPAHDSTSTANSQTDHDQPQLAPARNPGMSDTSWQNEVIRRKLDAPANLNYQETPWIEIEEGFEKHYGFNIVLDDSARHDALTEDEPITANLTGIRLRDVLRTMLKQKNATYIIQDGVLKIVSLDDVEDSKHFTSVFIDVRQILTIIAEREKNRIGVPHVTEKPTAIKVAPEAGKQAASKDDPLSPQAAATIPKTEHSKELVTAESLLLDLIQKSFKPDQWESSGTGGATIDILGGNAVVSCNEVFADGLRDFLTDLHYNLSRN